MKRDAAKKNRTSVVRVISISLSDDAYLKDERRLGY